jgi:hypothetical protein
MQNFRNSMRQLQELCSGMSLQMQDKVNIFRFIANVMKFTSFKLGAKDDE